MGGEVLLDIRVHLSSLHTEHTHTQNTCTHSVRPPPEPPDNVYTHNACPPYLGLGSRSHTHTYSLPTHTCPPHLSLQVGNTFALLLLALLTGPPPRGWPHTQLDHDRLLLRLGAAAAPGSQHGGPGLLLQGCQLGLQLGDAVLQLQPAAAGEGGVPGQQQQGPRQPGYGRAGVHACIARGHLGC